MRLPPHEDSTERAALGENVILLANLASSAWLFLGFVRGRMPFARLERWQTWYLIVYAGCVGSASGSIASL